MCNTVHCTIGSCTEYKEYYKIHNANFKFDQSVFVIHASPIYFWDEWG
jgi:hypothetical protein